MRYQRTALLEVLRLPYIGTARAKGIPERAVVWRHAWRNRPLPGHHPVRPLAAAPGHRLGLRGDGFRLAGAGIARRECGGEPRLSPGDGRVADGGGAGGDREPAHRSGVRAARPAGPLLVTPMVDALARAWRDPRGRAGALALAAIATAAAVGSAAPARSAGAALRAHLQESRAEPGASLRHRRPEPRHPRAGGERRTDLPRGGDPRGGPLGDAGRRGGPRRRLLGRRGGRGAHAAGGRGARDPPALPAAPRARRVGAGAGRRC